MSSYAGAIRQWMRQQARQLLGETTDKQQRAQLRTQCRDLSELVWGLAIAAERQGVGTSVGEAFELRERARRQLEAIRTSVARSVMADAVLRETAECLDGLLGQVLQGVLVAEELLDGAELVAVCRCRAEGKVAVDLELLERHLRAHGDDPEVIGAVLDTAMMPRTQLTDLLGATDRGELLVQLLVRWRAAQTPWQGPAHELGVAVARLSDQAAEVVRAMVAEWEGDAGELLETATSLTAAAQESRCAS